VVVAAAAAASSWEGAIKAATPMAARCDRHADLSHTHTHTHPHTHLWFPLTLVLYGGVCTCAQLRCRRKGSVRLQLCCLSPDPSLLCDSAFIYRRQANTRPKQKIGTCLPVAILLLLSAVYHCFSGVSSSVSPPPPLSLLLTSCWSCLHTHAHTRTAAKLHHPPRNLTKEGCASLPFAVTCALVLVNR
jgi:hypothetical protein